MGISTEAAPRIDHTIELRRSTRPTLADLMERAVRAVGIAFPVCPTRSRVEWLVGEFERASHAVDALVEGGYLEELVVDDGEPRLMLGERRWPFEAERLDDD